MYNRIRTNRSIEVTFAEELEPVNIQLQTRASRVLTDMKSIILAILRFAYIDAFSKLGEAVADGRIDRMDDE
jgi:hypothetical protein